MGLALDEAVKARGHTSPNPMVGAVLVRGNKLVARGYHHRAGLPHAEIEAMRGVQNFKDLTLYVTLEPCCHDGKRTPPCTQAILRSGLRKVVVGTLDPNPKVAGKGVQLLRRSGVAVKVGVLEEDCRQLNIFYNHWVSTGRPWVVLKTASSLDGKVALADGTSRWITGEAARRAVHQLRGEVDAVLVGIGTVLTDDPKLTARHPRAAHQPIRIILDPEFKIPVRAKVLRAGKGAPCWVVVREDKLRAAKKSQVETTGAQVLTAPYRRGRGFELAKLLSLLGKKGLVSLLVEGGPGIWTSFYRQRAFQELWAFLAPKLLGGDAKSLLGDLRLKRIPQIPHLKLQDVELFGQDVLLVYHL